MEGGEDEGEEGPFYCSTGGERELWSRGWGGEEDWGRGLGLGLALVLLSSIVDQRACEQ